MCKNALVMLSTDEEDNIILENLIKPLRDTINFNKVIRGRKLFDRSELPFIKTDEGDNYFGVEGIKDFAERELWRKENKELDI